MVNDGHDPRQVRRAVAAVALGNAIEVYDFVIFAFLAVQIGKAFFPSHDPYASLMGSLATFAVGFVGRPIGAHWLGRRADRHGRKPTLLLSMVLMGVGLAGVALTPDYATIGVAAPLIVIAARILQGVAMGGEIGISTSYLVEIAGDADRGRVTSLQAASQSVAFVMTTVIGFGISAAIGPEALAAWGWRVALGLGLVILPVAILMRQSLPETHGPQARGFDRRARDVIAVTPAANSPLRAIVIGVILFASGTIATYCSNYTATFAQATLHLSSTIGLGASVAASIGGFGGSLLGGWMCDRFGRKLTLVLPFAVMLLLPVPLFGWIIAAPGWQSLAASSLMLGLFSGISGPAIYVSVAESLPQTNRAHLFSLVYAVPIAVFGGTTQLFLTWLLHVTATPLAVAWVRVVSAGIALLAISQLRESAPHRQVGATRIPHGA